MLQKTAGQNGLPLIDYGYQVIDPAAESARAVGAEKKGRTPLKAYEVSKYYSMTGHNYGSTLVAMNLGIFAMLIVVAGVLGAFATFFIYLIRRANQLERSAEAGATADAAEQKGTV